VLPRAGCTATCHVLAQSKHQTVLSSLSKISSHKGRRLLDFLATCTNAGATTLARAFSVKPEAAVQPQAVHGDTSSGGQCATATAPCMLARMAVARPSRPSPTAAAAVLPALPALASSVAPLFTGVMSQPPVAASAAGRLLPPTHHQRVSAATGPALAASVRLQASRPSLGVRKSRQNSNADSLPTVSGASLAVGAVRSSARVTVTCDGAASAVADARQRDALAIAAPPSLRRTESLASSSSSGGSDHHEDGHGDVSSASEGGRQPGGAVRLRKAAAALCRRRASPCGHSVLGSASMGVSGTDGSGYSSPAAADGHGSAQPAVSKRRRRTRNSKQQEVDVERFPSSLC
jgi:hypothetical protein